MLASKLFVELLGTFVFISVIFRYASKEWGAFAIGAALAVAILFGGAISGGHFNPAVSLAMYVGNSINVAELGGYVAMQLLGGYAACLTTPIPPKASTSVCKMQREFVLSL